jgi:hypothetical protein
VVLALLLVWLPIVISCDNATSETSSAPITGYIDTEDQAVVVELPQGYVTGGAINPPGVEVTIAKQADGSVRIEAAGEVAEYPGGGGEATGSYFPNTVVLNDFIAPENIGDVYDVATTGSYFSSLVIAGIVDPAKPGRIKQYNQAFNGLIVGLNDGHEQYTPNVYKEKDYAPGTYYPAALGGFDVVLWSLAPSKIITLEVTQDGVTKTYVIDYSDVEFDD